MAIDWDYWLKTAGKVAGSAAKYYIDHKDQERKNAITEQAYRQYAADVADAKAEAQAAIDVNLTPMEVLNTPTTKADVSDFTAVAARGGLMNLPNRQRKRYASQGFVEDDIEIMEPESLGDFELQKEEGVNIGEQVFYDTGQGDRANAAQIWGQMEHKDKSIFNFDFDLFFNDGSWRDMIKGQVDVEENTKMAKGPNIEEMINIGVTDENVNPQEVEQLLGSLKKGGIAGLRHGGRPGYQFGIGPQQGMMPQGLMPQQGLRPGYADSNAEEFQITESVQKEQLPRMGQQPYADQPGDDGTEMINTGDGIKIYIDEKEDQPRIVGSGFEGEEKILIIETSNGGTMMITEKDYFENYGIPKYKKGGIAGLKKGGRVKYAQGSGIMDLGGLEKDYRTTGGFVPIGGQERADDVPARLSKNEFVMTADAVRAAGGGSINKGAQRMYDTMKHLEASPQSNRMIS